MTTTFIWIDEPPSRVSKDAVEDGIRGSIQLACRDLAGRVAKVYLGMDRFGWTVRGVGFAADDEKRLVVVEYATHEKTYKCAPYIDPNEWLSKTYADADEAQQETRLIQGEIEVGFAASGNDWSYALFSRHDAASGATTLFFAPPTRGIALKFNAAPCETPEQQDGDGVLRILAGDERAFRIYFPS